MYMGYGRQKTNNYASQAAHSQNRITTSFALTPDYIHTSGAPDTLQSVLDPNSMILHPIPKILGSSLHTRPLPEIPGFNIPEFGNPPHKRAFSLCLFPFWVSFRVWESCIWVPQINARVVESGMYVTEMLFRVIRVRRWFSATVLSRNHWYNYSCNDLVTLNYVMW